MFLTTIEEHGMDNSFSSRGRTLIIVFSIITFSFLVSFVIFRLMKKRKGLFGHYMASVSTFSLKGVSLLTVSMAFSA